MPILNTPMTIDQLKNWSESASSLTVAECCILARKLAMTDPHEPRRIWKREG